ncbi:anthranilate synthase component I family protein [Flavobacterium pallidum]|uniref:Aminodeoxychorismate synthase component I n=1 Tax=Flavobacterium pallidum TaxID=2172098 RepID=A0A2S1SJP0_9FLAO|nr:anthranilate synthase component I family protein [Flavobacterium pallidum]AWI26618.1 aminodeoxychorismate synthase component I [Flavobacterium pallidum]
MRTSYITSNSAPEFKKQLLLWSEQFAEVVFLDSNENNQQYGSYDGILAVDAFTSLKTDFSNAFEELQNYQRNAKDWIFGYLTYDLKNATEELVSENHDGLGFPDLFFFQPKKLFLLKGNTIEIQYLNLCSEELHVDLENILQTKTDSEASEIAVDIFGRITKESYIKKIGKMLNHIHRGDIYEANFCMEFYAENASINPIQTFQSLNALSRPPFAAFFRNKNHYLLCASPERYLKKSASQIISQPIKGTAKRHDEIDADNAAAENLRLDPKERSENIMIVDLVRNDLSKTAQKGSVHVAELCGIYSFPQVHQMISTITSEVGSQFSATDVIKTTFPMGSMTGAPKISAMKIIEELEETKRGLYSGAVGYFTPENDFDFNVVIRSILYNATDKYLSFSVGSAITSLSDPEKEYEECLLKAKAMFAVLNAPLRDF